MMSVEEKIKKVSVLPSDRAMRLCIAKFLENVSFSEEYFDTVLKMESKKKQVNLHNSFKGIQNLKKYNGEKN